MKNSTAVNMVIAQSGGPSMVINQSLVGAVVTAINQKKIGKIYGAVHGIDGILNENFLDMRQYDEKKLIGVAQTPSSALGSVRKKPTEDDCKKIFEVLKKYDIGYFFYIGGNDSAETAHIVSEMAKKHKFPLKCFHIPKTIDNDLRQNDHTPGYGSAARYVAMAFMGDNLDNVALGGVKINIVMGRHAGFLTAASALARQHDDDGPHLVYLPEVAFSMDKFLKDIKAVMKKYNRCVVAVSEGIADKSGKPIATLLGGTEKDSHGNVQLSGTGALGDMLAREIKAKLGIKRVRADTFGYIQRSFPGVPSLSDRTDAFSVGETAVKIAVGGKFDCGSIAIKRLPGKKYKVKYECVALKEVAGKTKTMPRSFINRAGNNVTQEFLDYAAPLVGDLPKMERLI
ncbi:MAG: 6-phosphofructokinase [Kiritimatiellae bacterium]|nr:6-phosphofructokinase [Kiritimatiellia bacterium]MBQ2282003.1 6-phosphofructokinase [Kiritimatiellia bacterium]